MKKIAVVSLALAISACTSINNEGVGTLTGGVIGGLVGSQFGGGAGQVAAAAGGALLGAYLGGNIGKYMDRQDKIEMQHALETAPVGRAVAWTNPDNGNHHFLHCKPFEEYLVLFAYGLLRDYLTLV